MAAAAAMTRDMVVAAAAAHTAALEEAVSISSWLSESIFILDFYFCARNILLLFSMASVIIVSKFRMHLVREYSTCFSQNDTNVPFASPTTIQSAYLLFALP